MDRTTLDQVQSDLINSATGRVVFFEGGRELKTTLFGEEVNNPDRSWAIVLDVPITDEAKHYIFEQFAISIPKQISTFRIIDVHPESSLNDFDKLIGHNEKDTIFNLFHTIFHTKDRPYYYTSETLLKCSAAIDSLKILGATNPLLQVTEEIFRRIKFQKIPRQDSKSIPRLNLYIPDYLDNIEQYSSDRLLELLANFYHKYQRTPLREHLTNIKSFYKGFPHSPQFSFDEFFSALFYAVIPQAAKFNQKIEERVNLIKSTDQNLTFIVGHGGNKPWRAGENIGDDVAIVTEDGVGRIPERGGVKGKLPISPGNMMDMDVILNESFSNPYVNRGQKPTATIVLSCNEQSTIIQDSENLIIYPDNNLSINNILYKNTRMLFSDEVEES